MASTIKYSLKYYIFFITIHGLQYTQSRVSVHEDQTYEQIVLEYAH